MSRRRRRAGRCWALPSFIGFGRIPPGENIVLVVTTSSHREAAFAAAEFLMDYLKTQAPFWKQVESRDGKSWVEAKGADDAAAARWQKPAGQAAE